MPMTPQEINAVDPNSEPSMQWRCEVCRKPTPRRTRGPVRYAAASLEYWCQECGKITMHTTDQ
jgi:hypothetical protein